MGIEAEEALIKRLINEIWGRSEKVWWNWIKMKMDWCDI